MRALTVPLSELELDHSLEAAAGPLFGPLSGSLSGPVSRGSRSLCASGRRAIGYWSSHSTHHYLLPVYFRMYVSFMCELTHEYVRINIDK